MDVDKIKKALKEAQELIGDLGYTDTMAYVLTTQALAEQFDDTEYTKYLESKEQ